jgi:hypothetical protein
MRYVPSHYPGKLVVFKGASDTDFACDLTLLWRDLAQTLETDTIGGSHLDIVRDESSTGRLAAALDARLGSGGAAASAEPGQSKAPILTALRWPTAMRTESE